MATIVAFHAHPDDEVLLSGGTLAGLADAGHRTVVVVATDGHMDETPADGAPRLAELRAAAKVLGVARVVHLGYADSGHGAVLYPDPPDRPRFMRASIEEAAGRLAAVLRDERADLLLSYDANGGYRHRDHIRVHEVGARAAELAGVERVLEATLPRETVTRLVRLIRLLRLKFGHDDATLRTAFSPRSAITHTIDVRGYARRKQAALAAHASQLGRGRGGAVFRAMVGLPAPVFGMLLGREWYAEAGAPPGSRVSGDILEAAAKR